MIDNDNMIFLFKSAYKEYTDASRNLYLASTPDEKESARKDLLVASQNFSDAYYKLKERINEEENQNDTQRD